MRLGKDRILTTHGGSLPRADGLVPLLWARLQGAPVDEAALSVRLRAAVLDAVARQLEAGVDVVSDGEASKIAFSTYVADRLSGFGGSTRMVIGDLVDTPRLLDRIDAGPLGDNALLPACVGPLEHRDGDAGRVDIENLTAALEANGRGPGDAFIAAVTPGQVAFNFANRHYASHAEYLAAASRALAPEYRAIVDAGFDVQLDSPDLAMAGHCTVEGGSMPPLAEHIPLAIEALNDATAGLPPDSLRLHVCWGSYIGPHHRDVELRSIIREILKTRATFVYVEAANPRHEHEWEVWKDLPLPEDKCLIVGVVDPHTNHVEHPELVAQRIERFANIVGKERVMAATDCGFASIGGMVTCEPEVVWLKLRALTEGAAIASERLW